MDCMQFMLAPFPVGGDPFEDGDPQRGAHVINNSWGCPPIEGCDPDTFKDAMIALRTAGVFIVASAGNDGPACASLTSPPPIYDEVFSVGAIDRNGNLASFSSIGPAAVGGNELIKPDIVAPGVQILSSLPGNTYGESSGTSMAGPHVVGVVALMWSANPQLVGDIGRTEEILRQSAQPYTGILPGCPGVNDTPSTAVGYGIVDAYAAVVMALQEAK
jgi:subtilisin family serine protease